MLWHMASRDSRTPGADAGEGRRVSLFRNGRNQAVRIPRDLELEGDEAIIRKEGDRLVIEPLRKGRLLAMLAQWQPIDDEFPDLDADLGNLDEVSI